MKRHGLAVFGLVTLFCGVVLFSDFLPELFAYYVPGCDGIGASASVGACTNGKSKCTDAATQFGCTVSGGVKYEWKENFPLSCTDQDFFNCDQPNAKCYRTTGCKWDANATPPCFVDDTAIGAWVQLPMRTSTACP